MASGSEAMAPGCGGPQNGYCLGCFTGEYPIPVPGECGCSSAADKR
ncbi:MAG: hypothetical protein LBL28_00755 [Treponema sp.]|nr:hypothetical protein [Treponema sp.]